MTTHSPTRWIAFAGPRRIASGAPHGVAAQVQSFVADNPQAIVSVFDADTSHPIDMDAPGSLRAALSQLPREEIAAPPQEVMPAPRMPGRPKLGVTAREVTLLPRHWEWLASQSGGASVALRKLVEQAQRANKAVDRQRLARESAYRFMQAMAGDETGFEEAARALFAGNLPKLEESTASWPPDVRDRVLALLDETSAAQA